MRSVFFLFFCLFLSFYSIAQNEEFGGVGIRFRTDNNSGYVIVAGVIPRSPADYSGIKKDDLILEIEGRSTKNMSSEEIKALIRGKVGTSVILKMKRGEKTRDFTLKRVKLIVKDL